MIITESLLLWKCNIQDIQKLSFLQQAVIDASRSGVCYDTPVNS